MILSDRITYPGVRSIAVQLDLQLIGVETDGDGVLPEAVEDVIKRHAPRALYLNPTLQSPLTLTMPERSREVICALARRHCREIQKADSLRPFFPAYSQLTLTPFRREV